MNNSLKVIDLSARSAGREKTPPCVLCLGNFDGVHSGHVALLRQALKQKEILSAQYPNIKSGVLTFAESTHKLLSNPSLHYITDLDEKQNLFAELGIDMVIALDFSSVKNMSPQEFVDVILKKNCNCIMTVCGFNFHFGAGGAGDHQTLSQLMNGNSVTVPPVIINDTVVSSTAIRTALTNGDVECANMLLGRPFGIESIVKHGRGVGNALGFATINQHFKAGQLVPARGVYASVCLIDGTPFPAISNVGVHPTFGDGGEVVCETHILDFSGDLYEKTVLTQLHTFIRPERKFDSPEQLSAEVQRNIVTARQYFENNVAKKV